MKRIVWIAMLLLAVSAYSYGQRIELPEGEAAAPSDAGPAPVVIGEATPVEPAEGEPASQAPMIGATQGRSGPSRRTMGMAAESGASTVPTTGRRGGFAVGGTAPAAPTGTKKVYKIKLIDLRSRGEYGPFPVEPGTVRPITVGDRVWELHVIEQDEEAKGPERTGEQIQLEAKLRRVIVPGIEFEEADLMQVVDYLSREADVNIVVTRRVLQGKPVTITLRLKNVPLYDAIRYVTEVVGLWFRIDDHAVVITDQAVPIGGEITPQPTAR
jgi:hypothetical protein